MSSDKQKIEELLREWKRRSEEGDLDDGAYMVASGEWRLARDANLTAGAGNPGRV